MIRVTSSRRRYRMTRHPLLYRAQRWFAVLIPLGVAVYVVITLTDPWTITDFVTPILSRLRGGKDLYITNAPGCSGLDVIRLLQQNGIRCSRFGAQVTSDGVLVKVNDLKRAIRILEENGVESF